MELLNLKNITKSYYIGQPNELEILHGISVTINKGEFAAIVGQSGFFLTARTSARPATRICPASDAGRSDSSFRRTI